MFTEFPIWLYLLIIFAVFLSIAGLSSFKFSPYRITKKDWKYWDFVWIILGSISIISLIDQQNSVAKSFNISNYEQLQRWSQIRVNDDVGSVVLLSCIKYTPSPDSPSNIKQVILEHRDVCQKLNNVTDSLEISPATYRDIQKILSTISVNKDLSNLAEAANKSIEDYRNLTTKIEEEKMQQSNASNGEWLKLFAPFLAAIAIGIRSAKAVGEVNIEENKSVETVGRKYLGWLIAIVGVTLAIIFITSILVQILLTSK